MNEPRSVFVVGVGRSGTSLLQSMLAAHSRLAFPPETGFLRRYGGARAISRLARRSSQRAVVHHLQQDPRLQRLDLSISEVVDAAARAGPLSDISVYRSMLSAYARSVGKPDVGDKDPRLIEHLAILHAAFPSANVVHIVRDPRDVLASKKKADWSSRHGSLRHVFAYRTQLQIGRLEGRKWFGSRYHEVVYEALLARPQDELRALCDGLQIRFEDVMLQFSDAARTLVAPDEMGWKKETMGPLLEKNAGKWRNALSVREVALVEFACARAMRQFNYASSGAWGRLPVTGRIQVLALYALIAAAGPAYRVYRRLRHWRGVRKP